MCAEQLQSRLAGKKKKRSRQILAFSFDNKQTTHEGLKDIHSAANKSPLNASLFDKQGRPHVALLIQHSFQETRHEECELVDFTNG